MFKTMIECPRAAAPTLGSTAKKQNTLRHGIAKRTKRNSEKKNRSEKKNIQIELSSTIVARMLYIWPSLNATKIHCTWHSTTRKHVFFLSLGARFVSMPSEKKIFDKRTKIQRQSIDTAHTKTTSKFIRQTNIVLNSAS